MKPNAFEQARIREELIGGFSLGITRRGVEFSIAKMDAIIDRIAEGETLLNICKEPDMPNRVTFHEWLKKTGAGPRYDDAVASRTEIYAEEIVDIADFAKEDYYLDENNVERVRPEVIARSKLRADSRKWIASKLLPKRYGDKVTNEVTGLDGAAFVPEAQTDTELARRVAFLLTTGMLKDNGTK